MVNYIVVKPEDIGTENDPLHVKFEKILKRRAYAKANPLRIRLQRHLKANGYDVDTPVRLYPGRGTKSAGAWAWSARLSGSLLEIGSTSSMADCLKANADELRHMID